MASLNKVLLIGNLTRDPEMRYTPNGKAVTTFSLAINRVVGGSGTDRKEDTSFVRVVCWEKLAETCGQYLYKGRPVFVEGRLQSRSWQAQDGTKRSTVEVIAQTVQFMGSGKNRSEAGEQNIDSEFPVDAGMAADLAAPAKMQDFMVGGQQDDEVPF